MVQEGQVACIKESYKLLARSMSKIFNKVKAFSKKKESINKNGEKCVLRTNVFPPDPV